MAYPYVAVLAYGDTPHDCRHGAGWYTGPYEGEPNDVIAELIRDGGLPPSRVSEWQYWEIGEDLWVAPIVDVTRRLIEE